MPVLHPATLLICWSTAVVALQWVIPFVAISTLVVVAALVCAPAQVCILFFRARWLFLSMTILLVWTTPGLFLPGVLGNVGMTLDGLKAAMEHALRLSAILGMLALLMRRLDADRLVAGLFALMKPLATLGIDRKKIALRMMLTLSYVGLKDVRDLNSLISLADEGQDGVATMHMECPRWTVSDIAVLAAIGGMVFAGLLRS